MLPRRNYTFAYLILACLSCATEAKFAPPREETALTVSARVGEVLFVNLGDTVFATGSVETRKAIRLNRTFSGSMPGSMGIPFTFSIESTKLPIESQSHSYLYFAAPPGSARASHSMLGSVIAEGDTVGIRISKKDGHREWYVDNSIHNGTNTIWSRPIEADDGVEVSVEELPYYGEGSVVEIIFDGAYDSLLHFTRRETMSDRTVEKEFRFDSPGPGASTTVGIRGLVFEVLEANNLGMKYRWVSLPDPG